MADQKLTALTEDTAPTADDLIYSVTDPAGTPASRKVTLESLATELHKGDTRANIPSAGWTGRLFFPTNSFSLYRDNNTLQVPYGPIFPLTEPINGDYSDLGSPTVVTTNGGIVISSATNGSAYSYKGRVKTAPGTPYTITAAFLVNKDHSVSSGIGEAGLVWRQSSDGKLSGFHFQQSTSGVFLEIDKLTNATTFSAVYLARNCNGLTVNPVWLRIADDGTNRKCSVSADGVNFHEFHSVGRTDFLTADQVGFFINAYSAATQMTLLSWKQE